MINRFKTYISNILLILFLGFTYGIFVKKTGIGIPCPFYKITGLYCPGCGITRMMVTLMEGKILDAISYNHAVFFMSPLFLWVFLRGSIRYIRTGSRKTTKKETMVMYIMIIIMIFYTIVRNI